MDKSLRRAIIAGNWKMNKTPEEGYNLISEIAKKAPKGDASVLVCPPSICLPKAAEAAENTRISVGAQNVHFEKSGAFTGEVSCDMLKSMGINYAIIGHSERRQYFGETDETVNKKVLFALQNDLSVIVCVGETLHQRELGITKELIAMQVKIALHDVPSDKMNKVIIAYEPVWAIGTGKTATAAEADAVCCIIRETIGELYSKQTADATSILYGGSMKPKNAKELLACYNVDGGLIGGAALKADDFCSLIEFANE